MQHILGNFADLNGSQNSIFTLRQKDLLKIEKYVIILKIIYCYMKILGHLSSNCALTLPVLLSQHRMEDLKVPAKNKLGLLG